MIAFPGNLCGGSKFNPSISSIVNFEPSIEFSNFPSQGSGTPVQVNDALLRTWFGTEPARV